MKWFFRFPYGDRPKSPSMRREWIEMTNGVCKEMAIRSPSMRREWIEMEVLKMKIEVGKVSLHAEGVD